MYTLTKFKAKRLAVPLAFAATLAMLAINEMSFWYSSLYTRESVAMMRSQVILYEFHDRLARVETEQLNFILSGRPEYLQSYEKGLRLITQDFNELRLRYQPNEESFALLTELEQLSIGQFADTAQAMDSLSKNSPLASLETVFSDRYRANMQRIRLITHTLLTQEADRLMASQHRTHNAMLLGRALFVLLSLLGFLAMLVYLRKDQELKAQQSESSRVLAMERDQWGMVARKRTEETLQLARYLQNNREEERSRLARNLHDDLGALLTSAKLDAARISSRVKQDSPEVTDLLAHLVSVLNSCIALGRKIIEDLRPSALNNLGLVATLDIFATELADSTDLVVHCSFDEVELPADSQLMVYRLMQEACTNIIKYAQAKNVWLKLGRQDEVIIASVRDDGVGFDTDSKLVSSYGLLGMRYRVEAAQGVLNIISTPGQGTLIQALL